MVIKATFFNEVSEIAIVPDRECKMPTLIVSAAMADVIRVDATRVKALTAVAFKRVRRCMVETPLKMGL
jgi:hypothetical protein